MGGYLGANYKAALTSRSGKKTNLNQKWNHKLFNSQAGGKLVPFVKGTSMYSAKSTLFAYKPNSASTFSYMRSSVWLLSIPATQHDRTALCKFIIQMHSQDWLNGWRFNSMDKVLLTDAIGFQSIKQKKIVICTDYIGEKIIRARVRRDSDA